MNIEKYTVSRTNEDSTIKIGGENKSNYLTTYITVFVILVAPSSNRKNTGMYVI